MMIARHGAGSHYVRPDRVYRTGVLQSIVGYQPQRDVMDVATAFTQGPYAFMQGGQIAQGQGVAGIGDWWSNLKARFQAWRARIAMNKTGMAGLGNFYPYGPKAWAGGRAVPMPGQRMAMLVAMQQKDQQPQIAMNNTQVILDRWNYLRSPTSY